MASSPTSSPWASRSATAIRWGPCWCGRELVASFGSNTGYFNTFGGNPVAAAVGLAVLDVIEGEGLIENARNVGAYTSELLRALQSRHGAVADVRHNGLYFGIELTADGDEALAATKTSAVVEAMREDGVLISPAVRAAMC